MANAGRSVPKNGVCSLNKVWSGRDSLRAHLSSPLLPRIHLLADMHLTRATEIDETDDDATAVLEDIRKMIDVQLVSSTSLKNSRT